METEVKLTALPHPQAIYSTAAAGLGRATPHASQHLNGNLLLQPSINTYRKPQHTHFCNDLQPLTHELDFQSSAGCCHDPYSCKEMKGQLY